MCVCVCCLTCDDGSGLASHLVFVHILSVVQFALHQDPGPEDTGSKLGLLFSLLIFLKYSLQSNKIPAGVKQLCKQQKS